MRLYKRAGNTMVDFEQSIILSKNKDKANLDNVRLIQFENFDYCNMPTDGFIAKVKFSVKVLKFIWGRG